MHRFFVTQDRIHASGIRIEGTDVNHIRNVLRMRVGDLLECIGPDGMKYLCRIEAISQEGIETTIEQCSASDNELQAEVTLFQCLPKGEKLEWVLQKAVELGVTRIIPVEASRCVVKWNPKKSESKLKRWQMIVEAAAKQSGRAYIPQVLSPVRFESALDYANDLQILHKFIPYEAEAADHSGMARTRELFRKISPEESVCILIGPEGGFAPEEVEAAKTVGFCPISLGARILRTETAAISTLSMLMYELER